MTVRVDKDQVSTRLRACGLVASGGVKCHYGACFRTLKGLGSVHVSLVGLGP